MNKIVAKCESHSVDIGGLHKVVDFIYEQALNSSEIIIQSVFGFMFCDCPWTICIRKIHYGYSISVSSVDWQIFKVNENNTFEYCYDDLNKLSVPEFYDKLSANYEDCRETRLTLAEIKDLIFQYFYEEYNGEDTFDEYGYYEKDIKDFTCYVIWRKD